MGGRGISLPARTAALILLSAGAASAQDCGAWVGATAAPQDFASAAAALSTIASVAPKDEFETTAQYEARLARATGRFEGPLVIAKVPEHPDHFVYDADAGRLDIETWAFDNTVLDAWDAIYAADQGRSVAELGVSTLHNLDVVIERADVMDGAYLAENGFGATAEVVRLIRTTGAIYQGPAPSYSASLFPDARDGVLGSLALAPEEARALKPQLGLAFVVAPKPPYVLRSAVAGDPTYTMPIDIQETFTIIVADFQCALLLDGANGVLAAWPMN